MSERENLRFAIIDGAPSNLTLPTRGYHDDAGLDLAVSEGTLIEPGRVTPVPTGLSVELPEWSWGLITGRSSALQRGLFVKDAVIDAGYRGELFANCWSLSGEPIRVVPGERICQLIIMPNLTRDFDPVLVDRLSDSVRGVRGFGSTGR